MSTTSIRLAHTHLEIDIHKYAVTDPRRTNPVLSNEPTLPFSFRCLTRREQQIQRATSTRLLRQRAILTSTNPSAFTADDLVLFKSHLTSAQLNASSSLLDLNNCLHQLASDNRLGTSDVLHLLRSIDQKLVHNALHQSDIEMIIASLLKTASHGETEIFLSTLMKILLRVDQLGRSDRLDRRKVELFNERLTHL